MSINDFLIPVIVLAVLGFIVFKFRKLRRNNNENFNGMRTVPIPLPPQKYDLSNLQVNIGKNLFIGFSSKEESEQNLTLLKDAKLNFSDKMKMTNPGKNSIIINNKDFGGEKFVNDICLGINEGENTIACLNADSVDKFEYTKRKIPQFKDRLGNQVYYNHDQPIVRHDKLCFHDPNSQTAVKNFDEPGTIDPGEQCITSKELDLINGNKAIKLKVRDDTNFASNIGKYKEISPVNVEYGPLPGFQNTAVRPFYMTDDDYTMLGLKQQATETCYRDNAKHSAFPSYTPGNAKASFIFNAIPKPMQLYSHIHKHTDKDPNF